MNESHVFRNYDPPRDLRAAALLTQEALCALVFERREYWNAQHPNKSLGLRKLDRNVIIRMSREHDVLAMDETEIRAFALKVVEAALIEPLLDVGDKAGT